MKWNKNIAAISSTVSLFVLAVLLFLITERVVTLIHSNQQVAKQHTEVANQQKEQIEKMQREIERLRATSEQGDQDYFKIPE